MTLTNPVKGRDCNRKSCAGGWTEKNRLLRIAHIKIKRKAGELLSIIGRTVGYPV